MNPVAPEVPPLPERQEFFQVKCPNPKCGGIKTTYASRHTICPFCGKIINVVKYRVREAR